ncbi:MAG: DUF3310 domain-containing protein [Nitrosopumilus sp.]
MEVKVEDMDDEEFFTHKRVQKYEHIDHPPHYTKGGIETLDFIEAKDLNYHRGNVVKYLVRAGHKPSTPEIEDLRKARFYLNREIEMMEKKLAVR